MSGDEMLHVVREDNGYNACTCKHCKASSAYSSRKKANRKKARRRLKQGLPKEPRDA